jgi:hypothetical protein
MSIRNGTSSSAIPQHAITVVVAAATAQQMCEEVSPKRE